MPHRKALVTLVVGEAHRHLWNAFAPTWRAYAARHGYEVVALERYIDPDGAKKGKSPHWQKCLILEHPEVRGFDDVVWLDSDIVINHRDAPCIVSAHAEAGTPDKVGAVAYGGPARGIDPKRAAREARVHEVLRLRGTDAYGLGRLPTAAERYQKAGLGDDIEDWINTGVLVLKPRRHADILRHVYDSYEENDFSLFDNFPLSYELFRRDAVNPLDPRFNADYLFEVAENYPFLFLRQFEATTPEALRLRTLAALTIIANNHFVHAVSGMPGAREDLMRIPAEIIGLSDLEKFARLRIG